MNFIKCLLILLTRIAGIHILIPSLVSSFIDNSLLDICFGMFVNIFIQNGFIPTVKIMIPLFTISMLLIIAFASLVLNQLGTFKTFFKNQAKVNQMKLLLGQFGFNKDGLNVMIELINSGETGISLMEKIRTYILQVLTSVLGKGLSDRLSRLNNFINNFDSSIWTKVFNFFYPPKPITKKGLSQQEFDKIKQAILSSTTIE